MNSRSFRKGDILFSTHRDLRRGYHPIVYFEPIPCSNREFIGAMITHSNSNGNIALSDNYFLDEDNNGNPYQVTFDNNYLVPAKLIKFEDWGLFTKVGELSQEGIEFFDNVIGNLSEETFANYYGRTRN